MTASRSRSTPAPPCPRRVGTLRVVAALALTATLAAGCGADATIATHPDQDVAEVRAGQQVFKDHCAVCHGADAGGLAADWKKPDADGRYPPPPLNGTAHAWHHPKSQLYRVVAQGTARLGGNMPAWGDKLRPEEISAAIEWFISLWPRDVYRGWLERGGREPDE